MTRISAELQSQPVLRSPAARIDDEESPYKDQSIEEQLLLIELKEVQRELLHSKDDAATRHAESMATSAKLLTEKESMQMELREVKAEMASLSRTLDTESKRANAAALENKQLQAELLRTWHHDSMRSSCSSGDSHDLSKMSPPIGVCSQLQESGACSCKDAHALWHALHMAREDAAESAARAAEASALINTTKSQLKQARDEQNELLHNVATAIGMLHDDEVEQISSISVVSKVEEVMSDLACVASELQAARTHLQKEQAMSLQLHEDVLREKRAAEAASASVAAKQSQLNEWTCQSLMEHPNSAAGYEHDPAISLIPHPDPQESGQSPAPPQGDDVAAIVSKWRSVSMQHVSEAHGLAEQLAAERKALQSMRSQALMLERQVETAEDQLEIERSSHADRESSLITQLKNMEAQVAEQERQLVLRTSTMAASEAQAESTAAELVRSRERVRVLEDMVKAAEVELQSAIRQMSDMQNMVISTDAKLTEAQAAMADRNSSMPGIKRVAVSLCRLAGLDSTGVDTSSSLEANTALQEVESLMENVQQVAAQKEAAFALQSKHCQSLQLDVDSLLHQVAKTKEELESQRHAAMAKQVEVDEASIERDAISKQLQSLQKHVQQTELEMQDAVKVAKERADQLQGRDQEVAVTRSEIHRVTADWHHVSGQLSACSEEVAALRSQVKASEQSNLKLSGQLRDSARELAIARAEREASAESQVAAHAEADAARADANGILMRLEESESRVASMQIQLEKRNQEVRELNSMLKAWEAMRLSKDAQIAALMERCKRYDEDIAEKGRSNEALRRKLLHHHGPVQSRGSSVNDSAHYRFDSAKTSSVTGSVAGSLSGSEASRTRHIHLHMHGRSTGEVLGHTAYTQHQSQHTDKGPRTGTEEQLLSQRRTQGRQF